MPEQIGKGRFDALLLAAEKPGRYAGGEHGSIVKPLRDGDVSFAFCFPDTYEVGMSHLGLKILYSLLNESDFVRCERAFMPWADFRESLIREELPLFSLENKLPLARFDFVGFTLQYELSYTNVLDMLYLAGIPRRSAERTDDDPLVVAGGPCVCNPEPLADFIDLCVLGEGEEVTAELLEAYRDFRAAGGGRRAFLREAARIPGVYVPSLYRVSHNDDGTVRAVEALPPAPPKAEKRIVRDLDRVHYPDRFPVPYSDTVHNRAVAEVFRGCIRGCRFCQAGYIYRPVREKSPETVNRQAKALCDNTGYEELSLASLSTGDYTRMTELLELMLPWSERDKVALSLPSLRIDNFPKAILEKISGVKKTGLTFAPEAGTRRLRDIINKNITEEEILETCKNAFDSGYDAVKLYFMTGLPHETEEDIAGIADLAQKIVDLYYNRENKPKGRSVKVSVSVAVFVPKPHTPFQWFGQDLPETAEAKQKLLRERIRSRKIALSWHDGRTSFLEAVLARGDRRLGRVLEAAHDAGCILDGWGEFFDCDRWMRVFEACGVDPAFYANRTRDFDEILPWDHLDYGVDKSFLRREWDAAARAETTPHCRRHCAACGAARRKVGVCVESRGAADAPGPEGGAAQ